MMIKLADNYHLGNFRQFLFLIALFLFLFGIVQAQEEREVIKINTDLVMFDVTVTDPKGKSVRGLQATDFRILENGEERSIEFFEKTQKVNGVRPMAIVFALDISGSVTLEERKRLRDALRIFINGLADKEASFAILTFGMTVNLLQSFTNDRKKLEKATENLLRETDGLSTHTYDAIDYAIRLLNRKMPSFKGQIPVKKSVIVVTDGFPVGDIVSPKMVIERANEAEISIYSVITPSFSRLQGNQKPLPTPLDVSGLVEKTDGKNIYATERNLEPFFQSLAEEMTASYLLAFYPKEESRLNNNFRTVKIEVLRKVLTLKQNRNGFQLPE